MRTNWIIYLFVVSMGLLIAACSDEDIDTEKPMMIVYSPGEGQEFRPGDNINFLAEFTDNVGLSEYKIDIHYGGDHEHKKHEDNLDSWHYEYIGELSGKEQEVYLEIETPSELRTGEYHFIVFLSDLSGNESVGVIEIHIEQ